LAKSFVADTSAKTGKPERTIQRDATRAKALGADLDRVAGTSQDKGELDAVTAMPSGTCGRLIWTGERLRSDGWLRPRNSHVEGRAAPLVERAPSKRCT
jgi:hypothetical protein